MDPCAGDVRFISVHVAAAIHEDDLSLLYLMNHVRAVREGTGRPHKGEGKGGRCPKGTGGIGHDAGNIRARHARLDRPIGLPVGRHGDVVRRLHQRDFPRGLDHAAARDHRRRRHHRPVAEHPLQAVHDEIAHGILDPERSLEPTVPEEPRHPLERTLILVPGPDLRLMGEPLPDRCLLEGGGNDAKAALGGQDHRRQAL